jgi:AraC-like DNA-binding protein
VRMIGCWTGLSEMSNLIRVDELPAAERFEFLRELVAQTWVPMECHSDHRADYRAVLRSSGLGAINVVVMDILSIRVCRTPRLIRSADPDMLKVVMPVRGTGSYVVTQDGRQARLHPGEFAFYDTRRPYEVACGVGEDDAGQALTFMFPGSLLPLPPSQLKQLTAVRIPASAGIGTLTSQFLMHLARTIDHCSPAEAARLSTAALEVLASRLAHELDAMGWVTPETHRRVLLTRIQAFVQQRLGDPELSPGTIAAAHHISLRYLHKLFQEQGMTVAGWIRQRRLEACRRDLADPALASRPVAVIAARWGYTSASHFGQVFRAAHGMPPQEYRQWAQRPGHPGGIGHTSPSPPGALARGAAAAGPG